MLSELSDTGIPLLLAALVVAALGLGALFLARLGRRSPSRRLPQQWPLQPRRLASSAERRVWRWLRAAFPDHQVMVKLPVTRFTMPLQADKGQEWFEVLRGAYCTFTVCDDHGQVIGGVDVMDGHGPSRANRHLKQSLLAQCGIGYWVVASDSLPEPQRVRAAFLGAGAADLAPRADAQAELQAVRHQLHEALDRNRHHRDRVPPTGGARHATVVPSPQPDSFLGTLDRRAAPLERA